MENNNNSLKKFEEANLQAIFRHFRATDTELTGSEIAVLAHRPSKTRFPI